ncbi:MAG: hypothetical protein JRE61_16000 [Deltaproteobacteria bacterium]|nr:hypothetical protein [Deltaproteobacteria bacterium]
MRKLYLLPVLLGCLMSNPAHAEEIWTEIGVYGFISGIGGETKVGNVTSEVDVSFSDILENLDMAFMGFAEHRRGKWSFIGELFYADISIDDTTAVNADLSVKLDVEVEQTMAEAFVGYRVFEQDHGDARLGVDLLGGARYNKVDVEIGVQAIQVGLTTSASRNPSEDWTDGVVGIRAQYGLNNGWGFSGWADYGQGSDSSSYQLAGFVNYRFKNNIKVFGGYRYYDFTYEVGSGASRVELDLDFSGPMLGVAYRF